MTDQELNEKLARAMGWDFIQKSSEMAYSGEGEWYTPDGQSYGDEPPGFCADAADSRALVEWIAADRDRMFVFCESLKLRLGPSNGTFAYEVIELVVTATLRTIAEAAAAALGFSIDAAPE